MQGSLIRYPLGIPLELVVEMARDVIVYVLVFYTLRIPLIPYTLYIYIYIYIYMDMCVRYVLVDSDFRGAAEGAIRQAGANIYTQCTVYFHCIIIYTLSGMGLPRASCGRPVKTRGNV